MSKLQEDPAAGYEKNEEEDEGTGCIGSNMSGSINYPAENAGPARFWSAFSDFAKYSLVHSIRSDR